MVIEFAAEVFGIKEAIKNRLKSSNSEWNNFKSHIRKIVKKTCEMYCDFIETSPDYSSADKKFYVNLMKECEDLLAKTIILELENNRNFGHSMILPLEKDFPMNEKMRLYRMLESNLKKFSFEYDMRSNTYGLRSGIDEVLEVQNEMYDYLKDLATKGDIKAMKDEVFNNICEQKRQEKMPKRTSLTTQHQSDITGQGLGCQASEAPEITNAANKNNSECDAINIFVSYSWINDVPDMKVLNLVASLRQHGYEATCDVILSQNETAINFNKMMAENLRKANKVIVVLSEKYKEKADSFSGGVGTEYEYILEDIKHNQKKYIFVSFEKERALVTPDFLLGREVLYLDNSANPPKSLLHKINEICERIFPPVNPRKTVPIPEVVGINVQNYNYEDGNYAIEDNYHSILEEYLKYAEVKPIASYGKKAMKIGLIQNEKETGFNAKIDISEAPTNSKNQEFVMCLINYIPSENWVDFYKRDFYIEFNIKASKEIRKVQLEIKNSLKDKLVDKEINLTETDVHVKLSMSKLAREGAWSDINEICFTIFLNKSYIVDNTGELVVTNLNLRQNKFDTNL